MGIRYKFLGQDVLFGQLVGDICYYSSRSCFDNPGTYFDPIQYMLDNGGIPSSDHAYEFYNDDTGDGKPVFGMYILYSGDKFRVGYKVRDYNTETQGWNAWSDGDPLVMPWFDRYEGCDPNAIKAQDHYRNGLYLTYINIASPVYNGGYYTGLFGYAVGYESGMWNPVQYPGVGTYEISYTQNPNGESYALTGGESFYMSAYNGAQVAIPNVGPGYWLATVAEEIEDFEDDNSSPAGGGGSYEFFSDPLGFSDLPSISIMDSGIATMWTPSPSQIRSLVNFLWSDNFFDNILKLVADPLENIIQFGIVPFGLSSYAGTAKEVKVGNVASGITMTPLTNQYIHADLGSVTIPEAWGTVMDYEPNTKVSIFLPYVGVFDMVASEVMNASSIDLGYNIDLLSGDFIAEVKVNKRYPKGVHLDAIVYHKAGNLMTKLPLTGANYGRMYSSILSGAAQTMANTLSGNIPAAIGSAAGTLSSSFTVPVERTGSYTGSAAMMGCEVPHIILTQPIQVKPARYNEFEGYASYITYKLSGLTGYTKVESVVDNKVAAPDDEKAEIERLLKEGVIL